MIKVCMVFLSALVLQGCGTISAVTSVAGAVVSVGATAVSTAVGVGGAVVKGTVNVLTDSAAPANLAP